MPNTEFDNTDATDIVGAKTRLHRFVLTGSDLESAHLVVKTTRVYQDNGDTTVTEDQRARVLLDTRVADYLDETVTVGQQEVPIRTILRACGAVAKKIRQIQNGG